ncbi:MAG TPA: AraD1 family protein [Bryobacteraceae bacterium]|jgi:hypothetical protein|nr:AraD1 family protein [Bryobacteraceae bacterium]
MRLIQIRDGEGKRHIGRIEGNAVMLLDGPASIYALAQSAVESGKSMVETIGACGGRESLEYDVLYAGESGWQILPAIDHPDEPSRCVVSGTGLTHMGSAQKRQSMHEASDAETTDSMRMYQLGIEGGRPGDGKIGVSPEWFYKGNGTALRAHGEPLDVPPHAEDGGEEPEIAGVYVIDPIGDPRRIGMAVGNEFSDHLFEKKNYLYLASSKLMTCALGPELIVDPDFKSVAGEVSIERAGTVVWERKIQSGEEAMSHSLANLEHHHFKHALHRRPGDVHVHFFGADGFSFGEGVKLEDGDVMQVWFSGFGRALRNPLRVDRADTKLWAAAQL